MPTVAWNPNSQNTAQVDTLVVTGVAVGGTLSAVINGKSITYTCITGDTTATAATGWQALLAGSTVPPEFGEIDFTVSSSTITATASSPGTPYTMTKSQSGGATCTLTHTTANASESDVYNASNWIRGGVAQLPQNGDDMVLGNSSVPLLWNLDLLSGVLLNSYSRYQSFTGTVGLPENNPLGYVEYRPTYFKIGSNINPAISAFQMILGAGSGQGPTRERYDLQSYRTALTVIASGTPADDYAVRFLGSHGLNAITVLGSSVGICMLPTEVTPYGATINTATVDGGGTLDCGAGCQFSGTSGGGTLTVTGGTCALFDTPSITARNNATVTLAAQNGTYSSVVCNNGVTLNIVAPMTITVLTWQKSSTVDASNTLGAVTVTTSTMDGDTCVVTDPNNVITWTNATTVNGEVTSGPFQFTGSRTVKVT